MENLTESPAPAAALAHPPARFPYFTLGGLILAAMAAKAGLFPSIGAAFSAVIMPGEYTLIMLPLFIETQVTDDQARDRNKRPRGQPALMSDCGSVSEACFVASPPLTGRMKSATHS